jgi:hypothetical protein
MKSVGIRNFAGQSNLKGKKSQRLFCSCCTVQNFKEDYFKKLDQKEIAQFKSIFNAGMM